MQPYIRLICLSMYSIYSYIETAPLVKHIPTPEYQGVLATLNNHTFPMTHISVAKKKCFIVFQAPANTDTIVTSLSYDPTEREQHVRLADIKAIEVPYPYATWTYKTHNCRKKIKYLLINIVWNDTKRSATRYLIEPKRRLHGYLKKGDYNYLTSLPFSGFKTCTIQPMPK